VGLDFLQGPGEMIDGIVLHGPRAVTPRVGHLQAEIPGSLLSGLDVEDDALALRIELAARTLVDRELRIDEIPAVLREPLGAVEGAAGFLSAGESELQRTSRLLVGFLQAYQRVHPNRRF